MSLGIEQMLGNIMTGNLTTFNPMSSNSKSGSVFFFSHDNRFLVKSLTKHEKDNLLSILPSYLHHLRTYPNTLLPRFYGIHRIKHGQTKIYFMITESVFPKGRKLQQVYDLKVTFFLIFLSSKI